MGLSLREKTIAALAVASMKPGRLRALTWAAACHVFSEKAMLAKMRRLADRGYIEYGIAPHGGWLTAKGWTLYRTAAAVRTVV